MSLIEIHGRVIVGCVPIEEYAFYLTGFITVLLLYVWLDEYWVAAYSVPGDDPCRLDFRRLIGFHPGSVILAIILIVGAVAYRHFLLPNEPGFPGYFTFLVLAALGPSTILFPAALPVINWRAFSLTLFIVLLTSLLWEATLGVPYGWWNYKPEEMIGLRITAWGYLPWRPCVSGLLSLIKRSFCMNREAMAVFWQINSTCATRIAANSGLESSTTKM